MTFSIAAVCPDTGMVGSIITSSSICVASRCAFVKSKVGVALTQNITNPELGPRALELMQDNHYQTAQSVLDQLAKEEAHIEWRQLGLISIQGDSATFSGNESLGIYSLAKGKNVIAMGNLLATDSVPQAMVDAFESSHGHLADRLLIALQAGLEVGGEMGPIQSAGLKICADPQWPIIDLRVDWHDEPITELNHLWHLYQPQMQAYITRAKDPANAESYGVPGDE